MLCLTERAALWKSLLDLGKSEHHLLMVRSELYTELTKIEVDRLVLHLRVQIARARGKLPESCVLFEQLRKLICNNATLGTWYTQLLSGFFIRSCLPADARQSACRCDDKGIFSGEVGHSLLACRKKDADKSLQDEAEKLLPQKCRGAWRSWKPATSTYPDNRPPGLLDN